MKIWMVPGPADMRNEISGIATVIHEYERIFPKYDLEIVDKNASSYDLKVAHAGSTGPDCDVCHCHGVYPTADYTAPAWEYATNARVIEAVRHAKETTVPSNWVADLFARNMRFRPYVVPHGIHWQEWEHKETDRGFILWNKNRTGDVCNPVPMYELAKRDVQNKFVTTFLPKDVLPLSNITSLNGVLPHNQMKKVVQQCRVYLATTTETFGVGILEAMASGKPVLGFKRGGIVDLVKHGVNGYLAQWGDMDDLMEGLNYCLKYHKTLGANGKELVKEFTWEKAVERLLQVYTMALTPDDASYTKTIDLGAKE